MSRDESGLASFADVLMSPIGGAIFAWLYWQAFKLEQSAGSLTLEYVDVFGQRFSNWYSLAGVGGVIGLLIGGAIHAFRT